MRKGVNLVTFCDLLEYAQEIGYDWNKIHDILRNDNICPEYECNSRNFDIEYFTEDAEYDFSKDTIKVMLGFMKENNVTEITVIND